MLNQPFQQDTASIFPVCTPQLPPFFDSPNEVQSTDLDFESHLEATHEKTRDDLFPRSKKILSVSKNSKPISKSKSTQDSISLKAFEVNFLKKKSKLAKTEKGESSTCVFPSEGSKAESLELTEKAQLDTSMKYEGETVPESSGHL